MSAFRWFGLEGSQMGGFAELAAPAICRDSVPSCLRGRVQTPLRAREARKRARHVKIESSKVCTFLGPGTSPRLHHALRVTIDIFGGQLAATAKTPRQWRYFSQWKACVQATSRVGRLCIIASTYLREPNIFGPRLRGRRSAARSLQLQHVVRSQLPDAP